jgi:hypothetical protein
VVVLKISVNKNEWNRLNNENLEQDFVSEFFISMSSTSPLVDKFSIWLFAGTGATGALLIIIF